MSFHVVLPSNSCMDLYPKNTLSNFRIKLAKSIKFDRPYVVALEEILYPKSNLEFGLNETFIVVHQVQYEKNGEEIMYKYGEWLERMELAISSNISKAALMWYLNEKLQKYHWSISNEKGVFSFNRQINADKHYTLTLHPKLSHALGFSSEPDAKVLAEDVYVAANPPPMFFEPNQMFIYCDFVQYQHVGDILSPLLRICVADSGKDEYRSEKYIRPYYVPVCKQSIDEVHIEVRTHSGEYFPFPTGKPLICKLHFQPAP